MKAILLKAFMLIELFGGIININTQPSFPGGANELITFIQDNLTYPVQSRENAVYGIANVTFDVLPNGRIENCSVNGTVDHHCFEAVHNLITKMPLWNPGMENGEAVKRRVSLKIRFDLNGY